MNNVLAELAERITAAYRQFASIRQRFTHPDAQRGGCPRTGMTPIYVRKLGDQATTVFPNLMAVESSFNAEQLLPVMATLLVFKQWIVGNAEHTGFAQRIVEAYVSHTRPYFVAALLRASDELICDFLRVYPDHAPTMDGIFRVAGSEGLRDLIYLYDARTLELVSSGAASSFPDILAFVDMHERTTHTADGSTQETRYEVWCPGYDLAKAFHQQCLEAAHTLVDQGLVPFVPTFQEEVARLPKDLVAHFNNLVRSETTRIIEQHTEQ